MRKIITSSASSINVLTERDHVMTPQSGFHLSLFANYTLDGVDSTVAISVDSKTGTPCGGWNRATANALSHAAFQPFSWPVWNDTSPSYTDVKIYNRNEILFHWFRADTDLSVQQQFANEFFVRGRSSWTSSAVCGGCCFFRLAGNPCSLSSAVVVLTRSGPMEL